MNFSSISCSFQIEEMTDGERTVSLTLQQAVKVLGSQVTQIVKSSPKSSILLSDLPKLYLREYGYQLKPQLFECSSIREVVETLSDFIQVSSSIFSYSVLRITSFFNRLLKAMLGRR